MNRPITGFAVALMLAAMCGALAAQSNKTLLRNANIAPRPSGAVAGALPGQGGAACTIRIVTSHGPITGQGNNSAGFGWDPCLQVSHYSVAGSSGKSSGLGAAAQLSPLSRLTVLREVDAVSPLLRQLAISAAVVPEVDIRLSRNQGGEIVAYNVYELTNAMVTGVSTHATTSGRSTESVTLAYQKLQRQVLNAGSTSGGPLGALAQAPSTALHAAPPPRVSNPGTVTAAGTRQPLLGTPGQPLLAGGTQPATLMTQSSGGSSAGPAPIPTKGHGRNKFEAVTTQRGVTQDAGFTNWANSAHTPNARAVSQTAPAPSVALNAAVVGNACAKDPSLRILGVAGSPAAVTFIPGHTYTILGCSFGADNPNNAVYLSDGSSFTWYLQKTSWSNNSVVVSVSTSPKSAKSNLMLFVLGQNGNTKLNNVTLR